MCKIGVVSPDYEPKHIPMKILIFMEKDFLYYCIIFTYTRIVFFYKFKNFYISYKVFNQLYIYNLLFLISRYLEYSLNGNISLDFVPFVWQSISHSVGVRTGFHFLRLNWEKINEAYQGVFIVVSSIFHDFLSQLSTEIDLEDVSEKYDLRLRKNYTYFLLFFPTAHHFLQITPD